MDRIQLKERKKKNPTEKTSFSETKTVKKKTDFFPVRPAKGQKASANQSSR
jgi:hypothetical protein